MYNSIRNLTLGVAVCAGLSIMAGSSFAQISSSNSIEKRLSALEKLTQDQQVRIQALEAKLKYVSVNGTDMMITGANLHLRNGGGSTGHKNSLGNFILGYNETNGYDARTGSHNLILGRYNDYESHGSIISGEVNTAKGDYTTILGGYECFTTEDGDSSAVIAGVNSAVSKEHGAVIAAKDSQVNGFLTGVMGGQTNIADGNFSAIVGGSQNKIWFMSSYNTIVGGHNNQMWKGICNSITGGYNNQIYGDYSSISGGQGGLVEAFIMAGSISGGHGNTIHNNYSSIGGGNNRTTSASMQFKGGGLTG